MKNLIKTVIILGCFSSWNVQAQKEANVWYFGENAGLDFNTGIPVALTNGALSTEEGCAAICDSMGILQFYTDGMTVYNKNHMPMPNADASVGLGLLGGTSSTQSAIIVPKPGDLSKYYIFTTSYLGGSDGLCYSEVDMNLQLGLGDVTTVKNIQLQAPVSEKITAVRHQNGTDIWVLTTSVFSNQFYAYLVSASGVSNFPVTSNAGSMPVSTYGLGQLKASSTGQFLAQAMYNEGMFDILKFNTANGTVSNWVTYTGTNLYYGIEFSPDESKLYVASASSNLNILQFDLSSGIPSAIVSSSLVIGTSSFTSLTNNGSLQIAPDHKIYIAILFADYLACISSPNTLGTGCGFINNAVDLSGRKSNYGLPNFITSFLNETDISVGIRDSRQKSNITLYPNPGNGLFTIELKDPATVTVSNALGQVVMSGELKPGKQAIDLCSQYPGIYLVRVTINGKLHVAKIIKE